MKITMKNQGKEINLQQAFEEFIKHCNVKNLSDNTIEYYEDYCSKFVSYVGFNTPVRNIISSTVEEYTLALKNSNITPVSVNTSLRAVRALLYYCMKSGYIPKFEIYMIKAEKKIKETYSDEELKILLKKPYTNTCTFLEYRNWVIVNYALATGNRLSTIINIRIKDLDFGNECVILQKTNKKRQQIIPLSHSIILILQEYISFRKGAEDDWLFCTSKGQQISKYRLAKDIAGYNKKRGIRKTSIHLFRHTFANIV